MTYPPKSVTINVTETKGDIFMDNLTSKENNKYEMIKEDFIIYKGRKLYRIRALKDLYNVRKGQLGGYIESEDNLAIDRDCWVFEDAKAYEHTYITDGVRLLNKSEAYGNSKLSGDVTLWDSSKVYGDANVSEDVTLWDNSKIYGDAVVYGSASLWDNSKIYGEARVSGVVELEDRSEVYGDAVLYNAVKCNDDVKITGDAKIGGNATFDGDAVISSNNDWMHIKNAILENQRMTFYKIDKDIYCTYIDDDEYEYIHLTLDSLMDYLKNHNVDGDMIKQYESCYNYVKSRFA